MDASLLQRLIDEYSRRSAMQQILVLNQLSFDLTVYARNAYLPEVTKEQAFNLLRLINEMQHSITGHISALLNHNPNCYSAEIFIRIIVGKGDRLSEWTMRDLEQGLRKTSSTLQDR